MKKLILLDLDNTLFDSASFRKRLFRRIGRLFEEDCEIVYATLVRETGVFDPDVFTERLHACIEGESRREEIIQLIFDPRGLRGSFHKEVMATLATLSKLGEVGIFSQGEEKLQRAKLSPIARFLKQKRIHITRNKKSQMQKLFQGFKRYKVFFIDDMLPMLYEAKQVRPDIFTIWIKRDKHVKVQPGIVGFKPDATVDNLEAVVNLVEKS